jgi:predicted solute-binding protein
VWACKKSLNIERTQELKNMISAALGKSENQYDKIGVNHGRTIGLSINETKEYLEGFNYRLGEREREAMSMFRKLANEIKIKA